MAKSNHNKYVSYPDWFGSSTSQPTQQLLVTQTIYYGSGGSSGSSGGAGLTGVVTQGSGNAVTSGMLDGTTLVLNKDLTFVTDQSSTNTFWELREDVNGKPYLYANYDIATLGGHTMYVDGDDTLNLPGLYDGIPIDNITIYWDTDENGNKVLKSVGTSSGGGGVADSIAWANVYGKPSWITNDKPVYDYSEIQNVPDLSGFVTIKGYQEIKDVKNFLNGIQIADLPITKLNGYEDVIYIDANVVVRGGVTMYYQDGEVDLPSIIDEIGIAGYDGKKLGLVSFSSSQFSIDAKGNVTIKGGSTGLDTAQLKDYLDSNKYTTETWVKEQGYASASSLSSLQTKVNNFLEGSDTDTIINKWKELEAFLSGLSESDNLATILGGKANKATTLAGYGITDAYTIQQADALYAKYLPLTGGELSGDLVLKSSSQSSDTPRIIFQRGTLSDGYYDSYIFNTGGNITFGISYNGGYYKILQVTNSGLRPVTNNNYALGTDALRYSNIYSMLGNFSGEVSMQSANINGGKITYDATNKYWKLEGDLLVTGGVSMYSDDSEFTPSTIMDGVVVDGTSIRKNPTTGALEVIGGSGATVKYPLSWSGFNQGSYDGSVAQSFYIPTKLSEFVNDRSFATASDLSGYLPLSGGTLKSSSVVPLSLDSEGSTTRIKFSQNGELLGYLGFKGVNNPVYITSEGGLNTIALRGSDGSIATNFLKYSRIGFSSVGTTAGWYRIYIGSKPAYDMNGVILHLGRVYNATSGEDYTFSVNVAYSRVTITQISGVFNTNMITKLRVVVNSSTGWYIDFYTTAITRNDYYVNGSGTGVFQSGVLVEEAGGTIYEFDIVKGLKVVTYNTDGGLYTGESIHGSLLGNSSTATKLKTARTIWGQSFDGSADVSGSIHQDNNTGFFIKDSAGLDLQLFNLSGTNNLVIGKGASINGYTTYLEGNSINFRYGTSRTTGMTLNAAGNVLIGTTTNSGYKLDVNGKVNITSKGDGAELLRFSTERPWVFRQKYIGGSSALELHSTGSDKFFYITSENNDIISELYCSNNNASYLKYKGDVFPSGGSLFSLGRELSRWKASYVDNSIVTYDVTLGRTLNVNGINISKLQDNVLYIDGNLVVRGGVTMYAENEVDIPSFIDSLPIASTTSLGVAKFDSNFFSVGSDGKVTFIGSNNGGVADSVAWSNVTGKPSWIGTSKPSYSWGEITSKPTSMPASDVYSWAKASSKPSYSWSEITSKPTFATVATSGKYSDLSGKPTIPSNTNQLTNGAGFITSSALSDYLPLSGGTLTGSLTCNSYIFGASLDTNGLVTARNGSQTYPTSIGVGACNLILGGHYSAKNGYNNGIGFNALLSYNNATYGNHLHAWIGLSPCTNSAQAETYNLVFAVNGSVYTNTVPNIGMVLYGNQSLLVYGGITMYSDIRKKTKLQDVELSLSQIANAPLIQHYYNSDQEKTTHVGSIAQYWARLNDWFCKLDNDGYYTMEIQNCALASAISIARHLEKYESKTDKKIRMLKKRVQELEDKLEKLEGGNYGC